MKPIYAIIALILLALLLTNTNKLQERNKKDNQITPPVLPPPDTKQQAIVRNYYEGLKNFVDSFVNNSKFWQGVNDVFNVLNKNNKG